MRSAVLYYRCRRVVTHAYNSSPGCGSGRDGGDERRSEGYNFVLNYYYCYYILRFETECYYFCFTNSVRSLSTRLTTIGTTVIIAVHTTRVYIILCTAVRLCHVVVRVLTKTH